MNRPCRYRPLGAFPGSKRLIILASAPRSWIALGRPPSPWDAGVCTTELTSIPGSTSIRVEGGP